MNRSALIHAASDRPPGHYAAFATSTALRRASETLVWEVEQGNWRQHEALIEVIALFNDEAARAYVMDAVTAMNIGSSAQRFVQSSLNTLTVTIQRLSRQIVPRLDEKQMQLAAGHVRSLSLALPDASGTLVSMTGFVVPDYLEENRRAVTAAIRAGNWESQRQPASKLLAELGDLIQDEIYLKSIRLMGFGFLTEKMIQGGAGVARAVQHQLVNWAVNSLGEADFRQMADYMESLVVEISEPLPHHYFFHPNETA